jgi:hypothetical protein
MKKKWFLFAVTVLILSSCFIYFDGNEAIGEQSIGAQITNNTGISVLSQNAGVSANFTTSNQTIILKNPTFEEMKNFLLKDPTHRKQYIPNVFECRHFATEVDNNAKAAGWECGFVLICYAQSQHAVVAFNTTDRGLIYIEPQTDVAIGVKVGGYYQNQEIKEILIAW